MEEKERKLRSLMYRAAYVMGDMRALTIQAEALNEECRQLAEEGMIFDPEQGSFTFTDDFCAQYGTGSMVISMSEVPHPCRTFLRNRLRHGQH